MLKLLRRLSIVLGVLAVLGTGLWFATATVLQRGMLSAVQAPDSALSAESVTTSGFPGALNLALNRPVLNDPQGQWVWTAPRADLSLATMAPNRLHLTLPPRQALMIGGVSHDLTAEQMTAEVAVVPGTSLRLRDVQMVTQAVRLGALWAVDQAKLALVQDANQPTAQLTMNARNLVIPEAMRAALPPDLALPEAVTSMDVAAGLTMDRALDRHASEQPVRLMAVDVTDARMTWGDLALRGTGTLTADPQGIAQGRLMLHVSGWRVLMPMLAASGVIKPEVVPTVENALTRLEVTPADGGAPRLELPLILRDGQMHLGPLPLGPAPRLY